jgi:EpsI family protein
MSTPRAAIRTGLVAALMVAVALLTWWLTPPEATYVQGSLAAAIPTSFGDWREIKTDVAQVDPTGGGQGAERDTENPYDEVVMRTYTNSRGELIMLALAYGTNQRQEVKIHRPELCYVSQGFELVARSPVALRGAASGQPVNAQRMLVLAPGRAEAVSYWIRIGNMYSRSPWATRYYIFKEGLKGRALDGILVRVSQVVADRSRVNDALFVRQEQFIADLTRALSPRDRGLLIVLPNTQLVAQRG